MESSRLFTTANVDRHARIYLGSTRKIRNGHRLLAEASWRSVSNGRNSHLIEDQDVAPHAGKYRCGKLQLAADHRPVGSAQAVEQHAGIARSIGAPIEEQFDRSR